jgi:hypothetical protein
MLRYEQKALLSCLQLHKELLEGEGFEGYDGSKEAFDRLYEEVYAIVKEELAEEADVEQVVETFYQYQAETAVGVRDADWWLYV